MSINTTITGVYDMKKTALELAESYVIGDAFHIKKVIGSNVSLALGVSVQLGRKYGSEKQESFHRIMGYRD